MTAKPTPPERVKAGRGRPIVGGSRGHGERRTYDAGCRCPRCTQANRDYTNQYRAGIRRARGALDE